MTTVKFPKIGKIIKEFFLSGYFLSDGTLRKNIDRLSNELKVNLDDVENWLLFSIQASRPHLTSKPPLRKKEVEFLAIPPL